VGATDYITKPIHWAVLRHRVRYLIQQSLLSKQLQSACRNLERLASLVARYEKTNLQ
jgi:PleD family two-component response regulator